MSVLDFPRTGQTPGPPASTDDGAPIPTACLHDRIAVGHLVMDWCPHTGEVLWLDGDEEVDPAVALAALFGGFDLRVALPGLDTPGDIVLVYVPDSRRGRQAMRSLPAARWVLAAPELWLAHDDLHLLMSPTNPALARNLARDLGPSAVT